MKNKKNKNQQGQAFLELMIVLPILFFMILFGVQIFTAIYEAQVKQEEVRRLILEKINYTANGGHQLPYMVEERSSRRVETRGIPFLGETPDTQNSKVSIKMGICRELKGVCE